MTALTNERRAYVMAAVAVLMWSTAATAFKLTLAELPIATLVLIATLSSALVLTLAVSLAGDLAHLIPTLRRHWRGTLIRGALNPAIYYPMVLGAYARLPAQIAQPINYTWAIVLTILAAIVLRQRITRHDYGAAAVCYLGVLVIATQGSLNDAAFADAAGFGLALASTVIWAVYWLLDMCDTRSPTVGMCLNFWVALPPLTLWCALVPGAFVLTPAGVAGAVYIGLFEMGLAFLAWSTALRLAPNSSLVANLIFLSPFVSLQLIALILEESIHVTTWAGLGLIIAGLLWQQWHKQTVV